MHAPDESHRILGSQKNLDNIDGHQGTHLTYWCRQLQTAPPRRPPQLIQHYSATARSPPIPAFAHASLPPVLANTKEFGSLHLDASNFDLGAVQSCRDQCARTTRLLERPCLLKELLSSPGVLQTAPNSNAVRGSAACTCLACIDAEWCTHFGGALVTAAVLLPLLPQPLGLGSCNGCADDGLR